MSVQAYTEELNDACPGLRMIAEKNAIDSNVNIIFLVFIRKLFILDSRKRLEVTFDVTTS